MTPRSSTSCTAYNGYRTCYYRTFAVGSRQSRSTRRLRAVHASTWISAIALGAARGPRLPTSCLFGPKLSEFGFPDEEAAFALQYGHGVGLSIWEKPIFSETGFAGPPRSASRRGWFSRWRPTGRRRTESVAARIEEEIVVTANGCTVITKFPAEDLLVAGPTYIAVGGDLPTLRDSQSHLNTAAGQGAEA